MITDRLKLRLRLRLRKKLKRIFLTLISILTSLVLALALTLTCLFSSSLAQTPVPPGMPSEPVEIPVEPVKPVMNIEVKDGLLSVEISDAEFGDVIKEIAEKARFKVEILGDVAYKKISTNFKGVDIEKGIRRLLTIITLMKGKDYTISYNSEGFIDKLEVYGESSGKPAVSPLQKRRVIQKPFSPSVPPVPLPPPPPPQFKGIPPEPPQPEIPVEE